MMNEVKKEQTKSAEGFKTAPQRIFYKNGKLNKVAVGVSALALVVALGAGGYAIKSISDLKAYNNEKVYAIADENIPKEIQAQYTTALNKYAEGEMTYEELQSNLSQMIANYVSTSGLFTEDQEVELNEIIKAYLEGTTIYPDIEQNKKDIQAVSNLLTERYTANYEYITSVEAELSKLIASNTETDDARYKELVNADNNLKLWLDNSTQSLNEKIGETNLNLTQAINDLKNYLNQTNADTTDLIKAVTGAVDYEDSTSYDEGEYVLKDGQLFIGTESGLVATDIETIIRNLTLEMNTSFDEMKQYVDAANEKLNANLLQSVADINATIDTTKSELSDTIDTTKDELTASDAAITQNLEDSKKALIDQINANTDLDAKTKEELTKMINDSNIKTADDLANLTSAVNQKIGDLDTALNAKIIDLDDKYSVNFKKDVTLTVGTSTTLNSPSFKTSSDVNIEYSSVSGFSAEYKLANGSLTITLTKDATGSAPGSVNATIYVNNAADNAAAAQ